MNPHILEEQPISIYDLKKEISKIKKRDTELSLRSNKTEEYLNLFAEMKQKDVEELEEELKKLNIPRVKESHIKKIIDLLPESVEELKVILQGYTLTVKKEDMDQIVSAVKKHLPSK